MMKNVQIFGEVVQGYKGNRTIKASKVLKILQLCEAFCADMFLKKVQDSSKTHHNKSNFLIEHFLDHGECAKWRNFNLLHNFLTGFQTF